jgi:hypothetical protein
VVAAATPQGVFAVTLDLETLGKSRKQAAGSKKNLFSLITGRGSAPPPGVEVFAVAVTVGWSGGGGVDGRSGIAIAASTKDHVYYAGAAEATSVDDETLVWRGEWCTSADMTGGAVDWPPAAKSGLWFEDPTTTTPLQQQEQLTQPSSLSSSVSSGSSGSKSRISKKVSRKSGKSNRISSDVLLFPKLWVGGELGMQELDLQYKTFRRLDGSAQGLPYENVTAIQTTTSGGSGVGVGGSGDGDLYVGTTMGLARRLAGKSRTWRYYFGARWLPGTDGTVRHLTTAREGGGVGDGSAEEGGCSGGCSSSCGLPPPGAVVVTLDGVAVFTPQCWTLAEKATVLEATIDPLHTREGGLVNECAMSVANDLSTCMVHDSDNDGLWTSVFTMSQIFRAATLAKEVREGGV